MGPVFFLNFRQKQIQLVFCHRLKERSITLLGHTLPICSRCTGVYVGFMVAIVLLILKIKIPLVLSVPMLSPLILDGFTQLFGLRSSTNLLRLLTGIIFSIGLLPIVEVVVGIG